ncbi:MAG: hypothetical protein KC656_17755, partial [Myxococcales bacterium]|nr:hypothetical protein [Myxococcales bacterium]
MRLLSDLRARGATELHLKVGSSPGIRVGGELQRLEGRPLAHNDTQSAAFALCAMAGRKTPANEDTEVEFEIDGAGRFRAFLYKQQGVLTAVVHAVA